MTIVESNFGMTPFLKSSIPSLMNVHEDARSDDFFSYFPFNLSRYLFMKEKNITLFCSVAVFFNNSRNNNTKLSDN